MQRLFVALLVVSAAAVSNRAQTAVTVFEGARVIVGDRRRRRSSASRPAISPG